MYLIDLVLPHSGMSITVSGYIDTLITLGYTRLQAISSLGGISGRSAWICDGMVTRM